MVSQFCGGCGAPHEGQSRFCVHCGAPREEAPATSPAQAVTQPPAAPAYAPQPRRGRSVPRGALVAAAGMAGVLAVGAGVAVGLQVFSGGDAATTGAPSTAQRQVVEPVTSQPTEAWAWRSQEDGSASVVADGDLVVVVDSLADQSRVVRLDPDGTEVWENTDGVWAGGVDESEGRVYVATEWEGPGLAALDADTGEEVWSDDDRNFVATLDDGRVLASYWADDSDTGEVAVLDSSGSELWAMPYDSVDTSGDRVVALTDAGLSARETVSGEVAWEADTGLDLYDTYASLAVTEDLVVVSAGDTAVGYDPASGEELWREDMGFDYDVTVSAGGPGLVYTYDSGDSESYEDGEVVFLGVEGVLERRPLDYDECCFSGFGFRQDGQDYFAATEEGIVYDEDLTPVAQFDGEIVPTSTGFYEASNGELSYHLLDGTEEWARQVGEPDSYLSVIPLDGQVLVADGPSITAYE